MNELASHFGLFSNSSSDNNVMCLSIKPDKDDASSGYDSPGEYYSFASLLFYFLLNSSLNFS